MNSAPSRLCGFLCFVIVATFAWAGPKVERAEPLHWWVGMHNPELQVLLYGESLTGLHAKVDHEGIRVTQSISVANPDYLFVYLHIDPSAEPGMIDIELHDASGLRHTQPFDLRAREPGAADRKGFDTSDVLYLITPDRFVNGDPSNDEVEGMLEGLNRAEGYGRHGGDIQGMINSLDYLADLGVTAIWINPVLENDQPQWSYHGYATTDFYRVDTRFGSNAQYRELSDEAAKRGIGLVMDMILNHSGSEHWFVKNPPDQKWINFDNTYVRTSHLRTTNQDTNASDYDRKHFADGWFVEAMPDLNQRHPLMADYLIQNSIWWVEEANLAGIRMDTYPYPDKHFMADWTRAVMAEYPDFNMVGEEWSLSPAIVSYWQRGKVNHDGYTSEMPTMMDFPLNHAVKEALNAPEETWAEGFIRLYEAVAHDFLYAAPEDLVIFPDNHDMDRFFTQVNEDYGLFQLGMVFNLTMRGVPQIYYGTEILMHNRGFPGDHGVIRTDFPGGWEGDEVNAFTGEGLTDQQKDAQAFTRKLLNWRKTATAIHDGKLMHFAPDGGTYAYFRYTDEDMVMVVLNKRDEPAVLSTDRFAEILPDGAEGTDALTGKRQDLSTEVVVPARGAVILDIK